MKNGHSNIFSFIKAHGWWVNTMFAIFFIGAGVGIWLGYQHVTSLYARIASLSTQINGLEQTLATTSNLLQQNIQETENEFSNALNQERENINRQLNTVEERVGSVSGTVSNLEKLSNIDAELLQKYSKVFFLNEHYAPERLTELPDKYEYYEYKHTKVNEKVWPYLQNMLNAAERDNIDLYVYSGYRSFNEQSALKEHYKVTYGEGTANQFSADQGYSEHQLGTTVDLITTGINGTLDGFDNTKAYQWLMNNAHKYGFVLTYPPDNQYYVFEPWHWRFVGVKLATDLHNAGAYFYDWDQRTIDQYLINIFD